MLAYTDDKTKQEQINGVVYMMSPRPAPTHNTVIFNLSIMIGSYLFGKHCRGFSDGVDVFLDEDNRVIPDLMIVCDRDKIKHDGVHGAPDLVVEVLSPSTAKRDRTEKKDLYEKHGVKEYWLIEANSKTIEVYILQDGKYKLDNVYVVYPDWQWAKLTEEEKAATQLSIKVSLYDDLSIDIRNIFDNID